MTENTIRLQDPPTNLILKKPQSFYEKLDALDKKNDDLLKKFFSKEIIFELIEYLAYGYLLHWTALNYSYERAFLLLGLIFFINVTKQLRAIAQSFEKKGDGTNGNGK